jgi:hypothetical protein
MDGSLLASDKMSETKRDFSGARPMRVPTIRLLSSLILNLHRVIVVD